MKKKRINLRTWMLVQIIRPIILLFLYWVHMQANNRHALLVMAIVMFGFFVALSYVNKRAEPFDELAKENLRRTDSICLKIALALAVAPIVPALAINNFANPFLDLHSIIIGYYILCAILIIFVCRAFIFAYIDKRGI